MRQENGAEAKERERERLLEEIEEIYNVIRKIFDEKTAADLRAQKLLEELEDKTRTIVHLQARCDRLEFPFGITQ